MSLKDKERNALKIPSLDFDKLNDKILSQNGNIEELMKTNRKTGEVIEDIKNDLDLIKLFVIGDSSKGAKITDELKQISKKISDLVPESPRMLSRCDAIVGNTQSIIGNIIKLNVKVEDIEYDSSARHTTLINLLISMNKEIAKISSDIEEIKKLLVK